MKHIRLFESYRFLDKYESVEDELLKYIDDGDCSVHSNNKVLVMLYPIKELVGNLSQKVLRIGFLISHQFVIIRMKSIVILNNY